MKPPGNIVLLGTDSRDSRAKAHHYARAARELGLGVRRRPDRSTLAVLPCSDFLAVDAARLARDHRVCGPDPLAVVIAGDKSLAYAFLRARGFPTLFWHVPTRADDLDIGFDRPVILKPERGSGSYAGCPWAYQVFNSLPAFGRYLKARGLQRAFFEHQRRPDPLIGRFFAMEYVDSAAVHCVAAVVSDERVEECAACEMRCHPETKIPVWMLMGARHPDADSALAMIAALADAGLRRAVVYLQCIDRGGRLHPMDINLRTGTMWALAAEAMDLKLHSRILAFQLGWQRSLRFRWPAPYVGIRRMPLPLEGGRRTVRFGEGCIPLITELSYDPRKPYDVGHAFPMFALPCRRYGEFDARAKSIMAAAEIRKVPWRATKTLRGNAAGRAASP